MTKAYLGKNKARRPKSGRQKRKYSMKTNAKVYSVRPEPFPKYIGCRQFKELIDQYERATGKIQSSNNIESKV
jgi:hypothetical protein